MKNALTLLLLFISIFTYAQDFTITNFDINLTIDKNGAYHVEETIDLYFTKEKRGIYRDIETQYVINNGKMNIGIKDIRVDGHDYKVTNKKNKVNIRIGNPNVLLSGKQRYKIYYTVSKGIIEYGNHQEFHFDLTGNEWKAKIEHVNFTINLPKSITLEESELKVTGGRKGQNQDVARIRQVDSKTIKGNSISVLYAGSGITAAIKFPKRYFDITGKQLQFTTDSNNTDNSSGDQNPWYIAFPLVIFGLFLSLWRKLRNSGHKIEDDTLYAYPPEGLTSAHIGAFVDQKANVRDVVSLLPYWASEGYLEMKKVSDDTYLYKKKNLDPSFPEYEHVIFDKLFEASDVAKVEDLKTKFYTSLNKAQGMLTEEVDFQDYYDQKYVSLFRGWKLILFPLPMLAIGLVCLFVFHLYPLAFGFILAGLGGFILPFFKLPLTEKGAKLKSEIDGFERFLKDSDDQMLQKVVNEDPKYFDKVLPFAVAFGLEKNFLKSMEPYMQYAPLWYHMQNDNRSYASFSTSFKPEVIQSAFSSTPQGTGASGGGGSFSSGSGSGGGGGGSW